MKKILAIIIALFMLAAIAPASLAADATVYVSISVDGKLEVAAQPVTVDDLTVEAALKAAHAAYFSGGESGYESGIDKTWNMFMISKFWGVNATPYVIVNSAPLGSADNPLTADTAPIKSGDNIVASLSSDPMMIPKSIALTASVSNDMATVTATSWTLDFTTFSYSSVPLSGAAAVDPVTGAALGATDSSGNLTVSVPESGIIAIDGLAAISVKAGTGSFSEGKAPVSADSGAGDTTVFITVSVNGQLKIAAKPVTVSEPTVEAAIKSAHVLYYSGGESGYASGIDRTWNMFMISKVWGVKTTPYVIVNGAPIGYDYTKPSTADTYKIQSGDNIIVSVSNDLNKPAKAVSLIATVSGDTATVKAINWQLNFETFQYTSSPLKGAAVVDAESGASLGTTNSEGIVEVPAIGIAAIDGLAAIPVDGSSASTTEVEVPSYGGGFGNSFGGGGFGYSFGGGQSYGGGGFTASFGSVKDKPEMASSTENKTIVYVIISLMIFVPAIIAVFLNIYKLYINNKYIGTKNTKI